MSLLIAFEECKHNQILMEVGESIPATVLVPFTLYPLDADNSVEPGDAMTCITCNDTRTVRTTV